MLTREELAEGGMPDFTIGQKEKDYVQHWILSHLSRSGFPGAFKGGTALQKAYNLPRYSEDLDFTLGDAKMPDFDAMRRFLEASGFSGVEFKSERRAPSEKVKIRVRGPLYNGNPISICAVRMEFSLRENPLLPTKMAQIRPAYKDLLPYAVPVMDGKEMAAEKVRAVLTRESARDIYDLYFLLRGGNLPGLWHINKKLEFYKIEFDFRAFEKKARALDKLYDVEMGKLAKRFVDFDTVLLGVLGEMKELK